MSVDELVDSALGPNDGPLADIRPMVEPQLRILFEYFLEAGDEETAKQKAAEIRKVRDHCQAGEFKEATEIMVANGMPEGYAASMVAMITGVYAVNNSDRD